MHIQKNHLYTENKIVLFFLTFSVFILSFILYKRYNSNFYHNVFNKIIIEKMQTIFYNNLIFSIIITIPVFLSLSYRKNKYYFLYLFEVIFYVTRFIFKYNGFNGYYLLDDLKLELYAFWGLLFGLFIISFYKNIPTPSKS
jgi:hypothetical protein